MAKKVSSEGLEAEINKILQEETTRVVGVAKKAIPKVADKAANELKSISPKSTGPKGGKYAQSWTNKKIKEDALTVQYTVYAGKYQLTHLLENGHLIKNGTGRTFGFTKAQPHISKAEKQAEEELFNEIKAGI